MVVSVMDVSVVVEIGMCVLDVVVKVTSVAVVDVVVVDSMCMPGS